MTMNESQKEEAIVYLLGQATPEVLQQVEVLRHEPEWWLAYHFSLGQWVRSTLRAGGFAWGDVELDSAWAELIEAAAERAVALTPSPPRARPRRRGKE